jgi:bifunctional non-homologous end joining protein LigD
VNPSCFRGRPIDQQLDGATNQGVPLHERKATFERIVEKLDDNSVIRYVEHFDAPSESVVEAAREMSLEGIVLKQLGDIYRPGQLPVEVKARVTPATPVRQAPTH